MKYSALSLIFAFILLKVATTTAQEIKILTNHLGYEPELSKRAVIQGNPKDSVNSFKIKELGTGKIIKSGTPEKVGSVGKWKNWNYWIVDFNELYTEGKYQIECTVNSESIISYPFEIRKNILEYETLSDVLYYFKGQRCSGRLNKADSNIKIEGRQEVIDAHGGWYDATGDYGKHLSHLSFSTYFNPQQIPFTAWGLLKTYQLLDTRNDQNFAQYKRRLLDEALYGADYLVRVKNPQGSFYRSVDGRGPGKKPEDRIISKEDQGILLARLDSNERVKNQELNLLYLSAPNETGYREGAGFAIAALALASTLNMAGDFNSTDYLHAAEKAFEHLEKYNKYYLNDGKENIIDNYCTLIAATELYKATRNIKYKTVAYTRAKELSERLVSDKNYQNYWKADDSDRPFFHAADAGMPVVCLINYLEIADDKAKTEILEAIKKSLLFELSITDETNNPFGYSRQYVQDIDGSRKSAFFFPHKTETVYWWQGENARLGSVATAARMASVYFKNDITFYNQLQTFALNQLNWILGENPYDCCMLDGAGRNNPPYRFKYSIEYTNAPGGICNGITSGFADEEDIDFNIPYSVTLQDNDWRWGEQWLPHATWYLLAISSK